MKLYGHPMSTCTRKVLTTLSEKGHEAEFVLVDIMKGEAKAPAHLARQPFGVVPTIDDDGFVLYESRAIIRYLNDTLSGPNLVPSDAKARALMEQSISVEYSYFTPKAMTIIMNVLFGKMMGKEPDMDAVNAAKQSLAGTAATLDKWFADHQYFGGDVFSLADIGYMPYVEYLFAAGEGGLITEPKHLGAWWTRVSERPSWRKATGKG
ncbi:MAG: glutathione S-transferase N-terminal domain-containing protein [Minicystis sp.]